MRLLTRFFALTVTLTLLIGCCAFADTSLTYSKGDKIQDFSFTTYDGQTLSFSDVLKEKEAVMINIWATWCGPCRNEFPFMQEAYTQYQDKVEIIALSSEPTDAPEVLKEFANQYGLTFKIGQDPVGFLSALRMNSIPTTLIVDRFGTICFVESGSQPDTASFTRLFDVFLGDQYTESIILDGVPPMKPDVLPTSEAELSAALGAVAVNPANQYTWPMTVADQDGRTVVQSTNTGRNASNAAVTVELEACVGDVIAVTFKTSTAPLFDVMKISLNGKVVKSFSGKHDWMTYAIPVSADGVQTLTLAYAKDATGSSGKDTIWVDCVEVLSGSAAEAALAANPPYPVAAACTLTITNPEAREITITDPSGILYTNFGPAKYYVLNSDTATFAATLTAEYEPETTLFYCDYNGSITPVTAGMTSDGYVVSAGVDSAETTHYTYTSMLLYPSPTTAPTQTVVYFKDEANLNLFVNGNNLGSWSYVDSEVNVSKAEKAPGSSTYVLKCVDQDGQPVPGAMLQICNDSTCEVVTTDDNGIYTFAADSYAWEIHVLKAPAGYTADSTDIVIAPTTGGEIVFTFTKN